MKYLFLIFLIVSCTKKQPEQPKVVETKSEPVIEYVPIISPEPEKSEPETPANVLKVGNCYRSESQDDDHFIRVEKKYDSKTFKMTVIKDLEFYEKIETFYDEDYFEYNCEAFSDMLRGSTSYKKPEPCAEQE